MESCFVFRTHLRDDTRELACHWYACLSATLCKCCKGLCVVLGDIFSLYYDQIV